MLPTLDLSWEFKQGVESGTGPGCVVYAQLLEVVQKHCFPTFLGGNEFGEL
jgi:hypothetical protein